MCNAQDWWADNDRQVSSSLVKAKPSDTPVSDLHPTQLGRYPDLLGTSVLTKRSTIFLLLALLYAMSWSTLSEDIWKHTLGFVSFQDRLGCCSRVSWTLNRAAAAATQEVQLRGPYQPQRLPGMCQWMMQHGQHLTSLQLLASGGTLTQLPCDNLLQLDLHSKRVQLQASSTQPGVLHSCTRLTQLRLNYCNVTDGLHSLAALSALVSLQHLRLDVHAHDSDFEEDDELPSTAIQHLQRLTYLSLRFQAQLLGPTSLQHASCLTNLQELHIAGPHASLSPSTAPGLSRLTALRYISLEFVSLDLSILQDCTQLQSLELEWVNIINAAGGAALPSVVGRLQQLQELQLCRVTNWPLTAATYSGLTASSKLQRLDLNSADMPPGIWPHVFPPGRQLPALQMLSLLHDDDHTFDNPPASALGTDDISCLVNCCPGLQEFGIGVQPGAQLADLARASGLTGLSVALVDEESFTSLGALSRLAGLQALYVDVVGPISPCSLLHLTTLPALTSLRILAAVEPEFAGTEGVSMSLVQGCYPDLHPDPPVWLQLLECCGEYSECQPLMFSSMGQQLAAQQQQISALQDQLAASRAQAAAEAAAAAGLSGRVQALEGQVQQLLQALQHPQG